MDREAWEQPDPGEVRVLGSLADWDGLADEYAQLLADGGGDPHLVPFRRCLEVARASGAISVVSETRYIDDDYRSEYSAFYSRTFRSQPDSAHRLHFFRAPLRPEQLWQLPSDAGYVGYMIVRPAPLGPVGRTMLAPPPGFEDAVRTAVTETVTLFGQPLGITAVPFLQQDARLGRCAHAAAWVCHYCAYRRGEVSRRPSASFSLMADPSLGFGRPLPSEGLTVLQLLELLRVFDLPCQFYDIERLPSVASAPGTPPDPQPQNDPTTGQRLPGGLWDTRIVSICCRYLNSGIPLIVGTADHAFVLCGFERQTRADASDWIRFVRHDDQRGPYLVVDNVFQDVAPDGYSYSPWRYLIVPLPEKLWLPPEPVEGTGGLLLNSLAQRVAPRVSAAQQVVDLANGNELRLRTYALPSNQYKRGLEGRIDKTLLREYRLARFPRHIWVVELIDRTRRRSGDADCVIGEAIFDATSSGLRPEPLVLHVPGVAYVFATDGSVRGPIMCAPHPYATGGESSV